MTTIRELFVKIGVKTDKKDFDNIEKGIGKAKKGLLALSALSVGAVGGVLLLAKRVSEVGDELAKSSKELRLSTEELQEFRFVAERSGVSAGALRSTMLRLDDAVTKNSESLKTLGVSTKGVADGSRSMGDVYQDVIIQLAGVKDANEQARLATDIFGRSQAAEVRKLIAAADSIDDLRKRKRELGIITTEAAERAEHYQDALTDNRHAISALRDTAVLGLLPALTRITNRTTDWITANREVISQKLEVLVEKIAAAFEKGAEFAEMFLGFVEDIGGVGNLGKILGVAALVFGVVKIIGVFKVLMPLVLGLVAAFKAGGIAGLLMFAKPLAIALLVIAAVAALALVIDDVIMTFKGGDTVLRRFFDAFMNGVRIIGADLALFVRDFKNGLSIISDFGTRVFNDMADFVRGVFDQILGTIENTINRGRNLIAKVPGFGRFAAESGPGPAPPSASAGRVTNNNISIGPASATISGSFGPMDERQLSRQMEQVQQNVLDGQLRKAVEAFAGGEI